MAQVDFQRREIAMKLVYYGPAMSGKTTNLQMLHQRMDPRTRGQLVTLDTKEDRTLYFDLLPLAFKSSGGVTVKVKLFTVPGQIVHNTTRKVVLQGKSSARRATFPCLSSPGAGQSAVSIFILMKRSGSAQKTSTCSR